MNSFKFIVLFTTLLLVFLANISETITDELMQRLYAPDAVIATINRAKGVEELKMSNIQGAEKLEKFVEDVK